MNNQEEKRQAIAVFRYQLISGVVNRATPLEPGEISSYFREVSSRMWIFPDGKERRVGLRTLERYKQQYEQGGLEALKPKAAPLRGSTAIAPKILEVAEALRRERPQRSVEQIIFTMEGNGIISKGEVAASTLRRHFRRQGLTRQQLTSSKDRQNRFRRFEAERPHQLWQSDFHHTLYLPDPESEGKKRKVKLCAILDDFSRYIVHAQYRFDETVPSLEDCLKKAIEKFSVPEQFYCDNGSAYSSKHISLICARLGIRLSHSQIYRPMGRGKIEKFFQFIDSSFKPEAQAAIADDRIRTLKDLNQALWAWVDGFYHVRIHGTTREAPAARLARFPSTPLPYTKSELRRLFFVEETRKVDKANCISLEGKIYEVPQELSGLTVQVRFDPFDPADAEIWSGGALQGQAQLLDARQNFKKKRVLKQAAEETEKGLALSMLDAAGAAREKLWHDEPLEYRKGGANHDKSF